MLKSGEKMTLDQLKSECNGCQKCELAKTRTNVVFGVGSEHAKVMFVGEGPGENEDLKGEPFVGRAGQLLDKFLAAIDLDRTMIYIANMVKCRPPKNPRPKAGGAGGLYRIFKRTGQDNTPEDHCMSRKNFRSAPY